MPNVLQYWYACSCDYDPRVIKVYAENEKVAAGSYANRLENEDVGLPNEFSVSVGKKTFVMKAARKFVVS